MSGTRLLLSIVGDVGLLLWGTHMVSTGVQRGYGSTLRRLLERNLASSLRACLTGFGITALLQSSTATGLMASSFTESGVMALAPALAVMLGANVGTAVVARILALEIGLIAPLLLLAGVLLFRWSRGSHVKNLGRVAIGLGLVVTALGGLQQVFIPVENAPLLRSLLAALGSEPLLAALIAMLLTWACHSSVAIVLLVSSLASGGVLSAPESLALVLGANVGGALPAVLHASTRTARRLPLGNLLVRLSGALVCLPCVQPSAGLLQQILPGGNLPVDFHIAFNLALAAIYLPSTRRLAALLMRVVPETARPADPGKPLYLESAGLDSASVALANATRETLRMADMMEAMLRGSIEAFRGGDRAMAAGVAAGDRAIGQLGSAIRAYLVAVSGEQTLDSTAEGTRLQDILAAVINIEHVSDIVANGLMDALARRQKRGIVLSPAELAAIAAMHDELLESLRLAVAVFLRGHNADAQRLLERKALLRELEAQTTALMVARLREALVTERNASPESLALDDSSILRVARDLRRIHSHLASFAYPVVRRGRPARTRHSARRRASGGRLPAEIVATREPEA